MLTMASQHQNAVLDSEQERPMLEGALTFLVILSSLRIHLGTCHLFFSLKLNNIKELTYTRSIISWNVLLLMGESAATLIQLENRW